MTCLVDGFKVLATQGGSTVEKEMGTRTVCEGIVVRG